MNSGATSDDDVTAKDVDLTNLRENTAQENLKNIFDIVRNGYVFAYNFYYLHNLYTTRVTFH